VGNLFKFLVLFIHKISQLLWRVLKDSDMLYILSILEHHLWKIRRQFRWGCQHLSQTVKIYWSEILCCVARPWYNKNLFRKEVISGNFSKHFTCDLPTSGILCGITVIRGNVFGMISLVQLKFMTQKWNNQPHARSIKLFLGVLVAVSKVKSESVTVVKKKELLLFT